MGLFLDQNIHPVFEKVAMSVKLSDNPDKWQAEVASEVYKQLPYLADYSVNVTLERTDAQRGYVFGRAEVTNKTDAASEDERKALPHAIIPIIVKERMLQPLDVFLDGEGVFPLNERRLREHLFRTDSFETSTRKPSDQGLVDQLYPPLRTNYGYGSAVATGAGGGGFGKQASSKPPLLQAIAPTISSQDADAFVDRISQDDELQAMASRNGSFQEAAHTIAAGAGPGAEKTAEALVRSIKPTVVQMVKLASGDFLVKWANAGAFKPEMGTVGPDQAAQMAGTDKVLEMGPGQSITVSTEKAKKQTLDDEKIEIVKDFGQYRCQVAASKEQAVGWVLPVMDFEMQPLPLFLFTNGQEYAVQDEIAGSRVGHNLELPAAPQPSGDGCFFYVNNERATALVPMTIKHTITGPEGETSYAAETVLGDTVEVSVQPGIQVIAEAGDGKYGIPETFQWLPLQNLVDLVKDPQEVAAVAEAQQQAQGSGNVDVMSTGNDEVSLDGAPLQKMAQDEKHFLSNHDAEFLLVGMGMNPFEAKQKIAAAHRFGKVKVAGLRTIRPLRELHGEMVKQAAELLRSFPYELKRDLVKEAAAVDDAETVDKVLAIGFLNPENISTFASYLPEIDESQSKLAEMLLAARMGLNQIPEGAVEHAMKHAEKVIDGLKNLQQKELL